MKVVGLLSWFDEDPVWLRQAVTSALRVCDTVVALDGAYEGFPGAKTFSGVEQHAAISEVGVTPSVSDALWTTQMEKRSALFELGREAGGDWFFVFDADDLVVQVPGDLRARLARAREDVAVYTYGGDRYHRGLFRSLPNLRVEDAHYHYLAEKNGRTVHLRGNNAIHDLEPFLNLTDLKVAHRKGDRAPEREAASAEYRRMVSENSTEATTPGQWAAVA